MSDLLSELENCIAKSLELIRADRFEDALTVATSCKIYIDVDADFSFEKFADKVAEMRAVTYGKSFGIHEHQGLKDAALRLTEQGLLLHVLRLLLLMRAQPMSEESSLGSIADELREAMTEFGFLLCGLNGVISHVQMFELAIATTVDPRQNGLLVQGARAAVRNGDRALAEKWFGRIQATDANAQIHEIMRRHILGP